jgi:asparagine synthase (glutamine-hydrolysing)
MGAIAAYLSDPAAADPGAIRRMLDAVPHRGRIINVQMQGACSLAVAFAEDRNDTSLAAGEGLLVAVCGSIDNLADLAVQWAIPDPSSAELVLAGYRALGDHLPAVLRGSFSVLLTDGSFLRAFRDHVGCRPLFFRQQGPEFFVATEAKQILAGSGLRREPERDFLESLLYDRYDDETLCALKGISRLPQGSVLMISAKGTRWSRFWHPERLLETSRMGSDDLQARFDQLMTQAVGRALTGQTLIALSGGIDSSALAAYAGPEHQRRYGRPLAAISAVYPEWPSLDERPLVELAAKNLGLDLNIYQPTARPLDGLRDFVRRSDGPAPSSFGQPREMYLKARSLGFRTILSGNSAEFVTDIGQQHLVTQLARGWRLGALAEILRDERARGVALGGIARQTARAFVPLDVLDAYDRRRHEDSLGPDWLDRRRFGWRLPKSVPTRGRWRQTQLLSFYVPRLAMEADEIEQASVGVQVRWPWLDVDLWEFFLSLRAETKYPHLRPRKLLIRNLLRGRLPDAILNREKRLIDREAMKLIDYQFLRGLLINPSERIAGVEYTRLGQHLRQEDLPARDFRYIRNLAAIHVFLEEFSGSRN